MKFIILTLMLAYLLNVPRVMAQMPITTPGNVESVTIGAQEIAFKTTHAFGNVSLYSPSIIRVRLDKMPIGRNFSYAVVGERQKVHVSITQNNDEITIITDSLKAVIQKQPYSIAFYTPSGKLINEDEHGLTTSWAGEAVTTYKKLEEDEHFIGLGEKTGNLDRRGNGYTNWNSDNYGYSITQDPLYSSIPFYIGIHHDINYGIFLDNTYQTDFNFGASNNRFSSFGARGGEMNYYFIYHKNLADIILSYTYLTGRMPIPPLWALGYQQNRYSYYPETEVMRIAKTLREKRIPADGITLDIHYMDQYQLFTWNKYRFPNPALMTDTLNKLGFKTTVIVDPGIKVDHEAPAFESGLKEDIYLKYADGEPYTAQVWPGWCNFTDFTNAKGRAWWRKQINFFAESGVNGIWNDMNEISTWGQKMPDNVLYNYDGKITTSLEAHNVYALQMVRSSYEGALEYFKERPFILSRSGYAGLQRYSAIWTGDNRAEDNHMLQGVRILNSLGLSGVSFTGMDIGGFTGNPSIPLYTKWIQLGAFLPYFRNHTSLNSKSAEPWTFGEDVLAIARDYISLRYRLMPYLYSTFYESTQNGMPVMRSLAINYTFDPKILLPDYQNQYEFGGAFMVAPFESEKDFGKVYFPEGTWYDLYNGDVESGKQAKIVQLNPNKLQVYVKGGSVIPMQSLVQSTAIKPNDTLYLHIYKGERPNSFVYYEDDGKSFNYKNGVFYKRTIRFDPTQHNFTLSAAEGSYPSQFRYIKLILHGFDKADTLKSGANQLKLQSGNYTFLRSTGGNDPQSDPLQVESCPVKCVTIENSPKNISYTY